MQTAHILAFDIGTTGVKTCLFAVSDTISLLAFDSAGYGLYTKPDGSAEQVFDEWWDALCKTSKAVLAQNKLPSDAVIDGISFCSQMQGMVLLGEDGLPVRNPMSYMDQRARKQLKDGMAYGPQIAGSNIPRLLKSLKYTGAVAASVKDPVWKYKWVEENEPEVFARARYWVDVKESLISKMTGNAVMTRDSAFAALIYDIHKGEWSAPVCKMLGVDLKHLPPIIESADQAGALLPAAAADLGLTAGIPVFGGGGDASLIPVGAGACAAGDTHVYSGTSGWVSTAVTKSIVDTSAMIAAVVGAQNGLYNYFGELETAGKCLEWVKDHLALDEIGLFIKKEHVAEGFETKYTSLYDYLGEVIDSTAAGSGGVIFTPWLHGNRCPFEDPNARGMFFNVSLDTGKTELIRAVVEGVCYHLRWFLEVSAKKVTPSGTLRFVGGGALSDVTSQILADVTGKVIEVVDNPQNAGAVGAAAVAAVGLGLLPNLEATKVLIPAVKSFTPNPDNAAVHARNFAVFQQLYKANKKLFAELNS
ncbi:MAG: FGGY-family carbohydrate kinase [Oscillospiraceae bacterium]|jgi:xylulokinase|nr:FGGY-family carbohydrate kinase [Oscillospiraceae bacterium]